MVNCIVGITVTTSANRNCAASGIINDCVCSQPVEFRKGYNLDVQHLNAGSIVLIGIVGD